MLTLLAVGMTASPVATTQVAGALADVAPQRGVPACVSSHLLAARDSATRTQVACHPQCSYVDFQLVCTCKLQLTGNA
jgi:hypothetical protein